LESYHTNTHTHTHTHTAEPSHCRTTKLVGKNRNSKHYVAARIVGSVYTVGSMKWLGLQPPPK